DAPEAAAAEQLVERLRGAIGARTCVVGLPWVHSGTGVKLPMRALTQAVAEANRNRGEHERVLVVLDAVHGFGNQDAPLAGLGVDFAAAGTHKWIFAPRGTGIIWAPEKNWALLRPTIPSFYTSEPLAACDDGHPPHPPTRAAWVPPRRPTAYEPQRAMAEAFALHRRIGRPRLAAGIAAPPPHCT